MRYFTFFLTVVVFFTCFEKAIPAKPSTETLWQEYSLNPFMPVSGGSFPYKACFETAARKYELPMSLLLAVAKGESNFDVRAISKAKCYGLMQIQYPGTAKHLGIELKEDLFNPCKNITAGAKYLRELMNRYKDNIHLVLGAYNYGPGRISVPGDMPVQMPKGAQWYSAYIYHHLEKITNGTWKEVYARSRQDLISFRQPYRVKGFLKYVGKNAPGVNLEWMKDEQHGYKIVLIYRSSRDLAAQKKMLRKIGLNPS